MLLDLPSMIVPDQTVIVDGDKVLNYAELRAAVGKVQGLLVARGVVDANRVGVFATNSAEMVEVLLGAAAAGATLVPMNYRAGKDEAAHLLVDSGAKVLFAETRYRDLIESNKPDSLTDVIYLDEDYEAARDTAEPAEMITFVDDDHLGALLYTSGTTSLPKGVMLTTGSLSGYVMGTNDAADGTPMGRQLMAAPLYHIAGITSLLNAMYSGRETVLMPQFESGAWLEAVQKYGVTNAFLVPTMLARVIDDPAFGTANLTTLDSITYGAAPMPPSVIRKAVDVFPDAVSFAGAYGQTETTSTVAVLDPDDHRLQGTEEEVETKLRRLRSVGKVLDDVEVRVVDEGGNVLPVGEVGEVQLMTFRAMEGYWGSEEKTRVTVDDEGWVHTGDMGYLDEDDYLFLAGRSGDMIIRGGENIAPDEVEAVLYEHPAVMEAAVVGVPDEEWGERVVAAVVLRQADGADEQALFTHCKDHLAAFKRPESITLVDELPRTSTGKLLRRDLIPILS